MQYTGSGGIKIGGCAKTKKTDNIICKWSKNSILYVKYKASKGVLEKVAIKRVLLNSGLKTYNQVVPIYQDTLNSLWNEDDLIVAEEAYNLVLVYQQKKESDAAIYSCG